MVKKALVKAVSSFTIGVMLISFSVSSFAVSVNGTDSADSTRVQELLKCGLTQQEADKLIRVEKISNQLQQNGQTLEMKNNKVVIKNSEKPIIVNISSDDKEFIIRQVEKSVNGPKISAEKKRANIEEAMKKILVEKSIG